MIANDHLYEEIKTIEEVIKKEPDAYKKASLKAQVLMLKVLHNIRTNQVLELKHLGVEMVKPKVREEQSQTAK